MSDSHRDVETNAASSKTASHQHCYLLRSLDSRYPHKTYVGYTVDPRRRLREHNGERKGGAHRTRRCRPWQFVVVVHGFPDNKSALQFEWAWQHSWKSKHVRDAIGDPEARKLSRKKGIKGKLTVLKTLLAECSTLCNPHFLSLNFIEEKWKEIFDTIETETELPFDMQCRVLAVEEMPFWKEIMEARNQRKMLIQRKRMIRISTKRKQKRPILAFISSDDDNQSAAACPKKPCCAICLRPFFDSDIPSSCSGCSRAFHEICMESDMYDSDEENEVCCPFCSHNKSSDTGKSSLDNDASLQSNRTKQRRPMIQMSAYDSSDDDESAAACPKKPCCAICFRPVFESDVPSSCSGCSRVFHEICMEKDMYDSDEEKTNCCPFCSQNTSEDKNEGLLNYASRLATHCDDSVSDDSISSCSDASTESVCSTDDIDRHVSAAEVMIDLTANPVPRYSSLPVTLEVIDLCDSPS